MVGRDEEQQHALERAHRGYLDHLATSIICAAERPMPVSQ
jgi:hypothetical protein